MNKNTSSHTYILLFGIAILACFMTYIVPAGEFNRAFDSVSNQTVVIADSYHTLKSIPVEPYLIFHKFFEAISTEKTASLIFFILLIGGAFEVIMQTGSLTELCNNFLSRMKNKELWIIPIFVCLFSVFGFTMGLTTASVVFVPIGIAAAKSLGIPKMCGLAMVALGTNAGFTAGIFNPFSVGIAQMIAELPLYSGAGMRWLVLIVLNMVTSLYLMRYAAKHRNNHFEEPIKTNEMTFKTKLVLWEFVIAFFLLSLGIALIDLGTNDIVVVFIITAIVMGLSNGFSLTQICNIFTEGCKKMIKGALIIGIAATIRLVLADGNIMDTITYYLTQSVVNLPAQAQLMGMFLLNAILNLLITSGSAKAALIMPLLTPMADTLGLSRQSAVFAYQLGDGLTNLASPVSTTLNGILAVSEEPYEKWIRFYLPLVGIYLLTGSAFILLASFMGY